MKMESMSRRQLAMAAIAGASIPKMNAEGPTSEVQDLGVPGLDPVAWAKERYRSAPLRMTFRAENKTEAEQWQRDLRVKLAELMGGFPAKTPLASKPLET